MSCGAEGLLLALKLATELVDKPMTFSGTTSGVTYFPSTLLPHYSKPDWQRMIDEGEEKIAEGKRIKAELDAAVVKYKKRVEFHKMAEKCLDKTGKGYIYSDTGKGAVIQDLPPGTLVIDPRIRLEQSDGCLVSDGTGKWTPCGLPKKKDSFIVDPPEHCLMPDGKGNFVTKPAPCSK